MKTKFNTRNPKILFFAIAGLFISIGIVSATEIPRKVKTGNASAQSEESIQLENWMLDPGCWIQEGKGLLLCETEESEIRLEAWMINPQDDTWLREREETIEMETWMSDIDDEFWTDLINDEDIDLEAWMSHPENWIQSGDITYLATF